MFEQIAAAGVDYDDVDRHARARGRREVRRLVRRAARRDRGLGPRARHGVSVDAGARPADLGARRRPSGPASGEDQWLGWLDEPARMRERVPSSRRSRPASSRTGIDDVVLAGMGGSSLAPEVFRRTFDGDELPRARHDAPGRDPRARGASSTSSARSSSSPRSRGRRSRRAATSTYFWERTGGRGEQFAAITDPGSALERARASSAASAPSGTASPTIGGRYSALSLFGLVPAALMGVDLGRLLERDARDGGGVPARRRAIPGSTWACASARAAREGRDKVLRQPDAGRLRALGRAAPRRVHRQGGQGPRARAGRDADGPDRQAEDVRVPDPYELGQEFFRWEFATAVAGSLIGINPFDQPDVQAAKDRTKALLARATTPSSSRSARSTSCSRRREPGDYVCVQAFVEPDARGRAAHRAAVASASARPAASSRRGFGPRYLHSTGQLHKGGPPTGLFLQVVDEPRGAADSRARRSGSGGSSARRRPATSRRCASAAGRSRASDWRSIGMKLGMVGLGRMGGNMTERLRARRARGADATTRSGGGTARVARGARRPARGAARRLADDPGRRSDRGRRSRSCSSSLDAGDVIVDGGNSNFRDSQRRAPRRAEKGIRFVDAGVSGGIWGLTRGLLPDGRRRRRAAVALLEPAFDDARARRTATRTSARPAPGTS